MVCGVAGRKRKALEAKRAGRTSTDRKNKTKQEYPVGDSGSCRNANNAKVLSSRQGTLDQEVIKVARKKEYYCSTAEVLQRITVLSVVRFVATVSCQQQQINVSREPPPLVPCPHHHEPQSKTDLSVACVVFITY